MARRPAMSRQELRAALDRMPRVSMATLPTPLHEAPRLSSALGGPRILVKRDDLTGLGFGGNKVRHMEFCMADALDRDADVAININLPVSHPGLSNNARITAAAAIRAGLRYICVVPNGVDKPMDGNRLLLDLMGAEFHLLESPDEESARSYAADLAEQLRSEGRTPYVVPLEPLTRAWGVMSYINAALEIADQLEAMEIQDVAVYLGTGASHGGLALAAKALGLPWRITGVMRSAPSTYAAHVPVWVRDAVEALDLSVSLEPDDLIQTDEYMGPGPAVPSTESIEAVRKMAETEGIILEPLYTGKALAAVIDHARKGILTSKDTVLFVHTGGLPELFNYADVLKR